MFSVTLKVLVCAFIHLPEWILLVVAASTGLFIPSTNILIMKVHDVIK